MLLTRTKTGDPLVSTEDAADFLKVTETVEHPLIEALVEAATMHCESYTARDVRMNEYELLIDGFSDTTAPDILLCKAGVGAVSEVARLVADAWTVVATSVYYLKPELSRSFVKLVWNQTWPSDLDTRDHNVRVRFSTAPHKDLALCREGILRHTALMYADRGDAQPLKSEAGASGGGATLSVSTARQSGAESLYGPIALVGI